MNEKIIANVLFIFLETWLNLMENHFLQLTVDFHTMIEHDQNFVIKFKRKSKEIEEDIN